jgi:hypothetical protein
MRKIPQIQRNQCCMESINAQNSDVEEGIHISCFQFQHLNPSLWTVVELQRREYFRKRSLGRRITNVGKQLAISYSFYDRCGRGSVSDQRKARVKYILQPSISCQKSTGYPLIVGMGLILERIISQRT